MNPELAAEAKERGNDAFRAQDWATAIKEYEEAIKRDPKNPAYQNNLSATLCKVAPPFCPSLPLSFAGSCLRRAYARTLRGKERVP